MILLSTTAFVGSQFLLCMALILVPLGGEEVVRVCARFVAEWWFTFAAGVVELLCGTRVEASTDFARMEDRRVVVICNHHSDVDWTYLWCLAVRCGRCSELCFVLKNSLKGAPCFGWAAQAFLFIFLSRKRDLDLIEILSRSRYLSSESSNCFMIIFPEGSDLSESNVEKSQKFGATMNPPIKWSRVLIPRAAGTYAAIRGLRPDAVYDLTVSYPENSERPSASQVWLKGIYPKVVRIVGERFDNLKKTKTEEEFKTWLTERFALKEKRLGAEKPPKKTAAVPTKKYMVAFFVWTVVMVAFFYALYRNVSFRLAVATGCGLWIAVTKFFGGLDTVLTHRYNLTHQ